MARAAAQPAPEASEEDAARALRVEAAVQLRDLLRAPHAQARHKAALIGQQSEQAPAPRPARPAAAAPASQAARAGGLRRNMPARAPAGPLAPPPAPAARPEAN